MFNSFSSWLTFSNYFTVNCFNGKLSNPIFIFFKQAFKNSGYQLYFSVILFEIEYFFYKEWRISWVKNGKNSFILFLRRVYYLSCDQNKGR